MYHPYQFAPQAYNTDALRRAIPEIVDDHALTWLCYDHFPQVYQAWQTDTSRHQKIQWLVDFCARHKRFDDLLPLLRQSNPIAYLTLDPAFRRLQAEHTKSARLFIAYKSQASLDHQLAVFLYEFLTRLGHDVFTDEHISSNPSRLAEMAQQIKHSDLFVVLMSQQAVDSELMRAELKLANDYREQQGQPAIVMVQMVRSDNLPYSIEALLPRLQDVTWGEPTDHERVADQILQAILNFQQAQTLRDPSRPVTITAPPPPTPRPRTITDESVVGDDGLITDSRIRTVQPPLPEFDPRFIDIPAHDFDSSDIDVPGGALQIQDRFYIKRPGDQTLLEQLRRSNGTTTTIRAPRQMGKSSLLVRGMHQARSQGANVVYFDLQGTDRYYLQSLDYFLRHLAEMMVRKLRLDLQVLKEAWQDSYLGPKDKLTYFMEDHLLRASDKPLVLALDEVDLLVQEDGNLHTEFFSLLRSWHNNRAYDFERLWERLYIVMVISTEPYLLIQDVHQSPFNVGHKIALNDFEQVQVYELNWRHGVPIKGRDFRDFHGLLNGHPYLTRKALYAMAVEGLTWPELSAVATNDNGPFADHLLRHYWLLVNDELGLVEALREVITHKRCRDEFARLRLLKAGLIVGSGDHYLCRCDLYRRYFREKLG